VLRPQQITASWLAHVTDAGAWQRGRRYFRQGRAELEQAIQVKGDQIVLSGQCRGSEFEPYRQHVSIRAGRKQPILNGECSCPVGFNCKHVVALVLTWLALEPREAVQTDEVSDWLGEQPGQAVDDLTGKADAGGEVLHYLLAPDARASAGLSLTLQLARKRRDGDWGKPRRVSLASINSSWAVPRYLQPIDHEILSLIRISGLDNSYSLHRPSTTAGCLALIMMVSSGRCFWQGDLDRPLQRAPERRLQAQWHEDAGAYRLQLSTDPLAQLVLTDPPCYIDGAAREFGTVVAPEALDGETLAWLQQAPRIPRQAAQALSRRLALSLPELPTPVPVAMRDLEVPPHGHLTIEFDPSAARTARARLSYRYAELRVDPGQTEVEQIFDQEHELVRLHRDPDAEQRLRAALSDHRLEPVDPENFRIAGMLEGTALRDAWFEWLRAPADALRQAGWTIEWNGEQQFNLSEVEHIDGEIEREGNDWFSLRFDLEFDGWRMPLLPLVSQLLAHYTPGQLPETLYLDVGEGHYVSVPAEQIEPVLKTLIDLFDRIDDDRLELARPDAGRLLDFGDIPIRGATSLTALARKLADFSGLKPVKLPTTFKGELRPYQQQGLDWLQFLREHGFGGILADDMGLGKTVQALAHLAVEKRAGRMQQPSLIVAPTSLMGNWRHEAQTFTPQLKTLVLHGPERAGDFDRLGEFDLVLTTYPLLPRDREILLAQHWHCLILDEAQQIKNPLAKAAQVVRRLQCKHRLCLTGTPMENHLGELWAQFDFLMPGFLGDQTSFVHNYRTPIERHGDGARLQNLQRRTAPFLLRRTKDRVAAELPPKTEMLRTAEFEPRQARLYESIRLTMEKKVRKAIAAKGLARSHIIVLDALLKLRQVCCDPRLLTRSTAEARNVPSAKFNLLFELLPELLEEGRRVLLFSQFTTMLGLIEDELRRRGIDYTKLTGQTRKRDEAIQRFRDGEVSLFLISLKAGGVGLNLVEADTVIHYDPWWNPAVEHQATDRAHRIGQDKPVFVYKLVAAGTVEEKILELQARKQKLAEDIYGRGKKSDQPPIDEDTIQALLQAD